MSQSHHPSLGMWTRRELLSVASLGVLGYDVNREFALSYVVNCRWRRGEVVTLVNSIYSNNCVVAWVFYI